MDKIRIKLRPVALVLLFITFYYYDPDSGLAPSQLLCRLLSSKNDPVIKYACMQIRVLLCTESGTTLSLNRNEPVIKCACMLTRYNCALNRELLCFDFQTCMTKREQLCLTRVNVLKGSGRICQLHIISDNNLSSLVTSCPLSLLRTVCRLYDFYLVKNGVLPYFFIVGVQNRNVFARDRTKNPFSLYKFNSIQMYLNGQEHFPKTIKRTDNDYSEMYNTFLDESGRLRPQGGVRGQF